MFFGEREEVKCMPDEKYDKQDQITAFLFKAINALFINSPQKTALGVLLDMLPL